MPEVPDRSPQAMGEAIMRLIGMAVAAYIKVGQQPVEIAVEGGIKVRCWPVDDLVEVTIISEDGERRGITMTPEQCLEIADFV